MGYRLGVDVGGTFTDLLLVDDRTGAIHAAKVPSTPDDSSRGVVTGIARICERTGIPPGAIRRSKSNHAPHEPHEKAQTGSRYPGIHHKGTKAQRSP